MINVINLAEKIFLQDIGNPATQDVATEIVAEAALFSAHTFSAAVTQYEAGQFNEHFKRLNSEREGLPKAEQHCAEHRTAEVTEFDPIQHFMESLLRGIDQAKKAA